MSMVGGCGAVKCAGSDHNVPRLTVLRMGEFATEAYSQAVGTGSEPGKDVVPTLCRVSTNEALDRSHPRTGRTCPAL